MIAVRLAFTLALASLALVSTAEAVTIQGLGAQSCSVWVDEHRKDSIKATAKDAWLGGFLSAYNIYGPERTGNILQTSDFRGAVGWVTNHCSVNSLDSIADAAARLIAELFARLR